MNTLGALRKEAIHDQVYRALRERIISRRIKPGDRIGETELSRELGVSRTPIREAFRRLLQEGFLVSIPSKGVFAFKPSASEIIELYDCRIALEGMAFARAAERIDDNSLAQLDRFLSGAEQGFSQGELDRAVEFNVKFHNAAIRSSGNNRLIQMMDNLRGPLLQYRSVNLRLRGRDIVDEHRAIYLALQARDPIASEARLREHLERDKAAVLHILSEKTDVLGQRTG